jgi:hypothetical protein
VPVFVQDIAAYNASQAGYFCCPLVSRWRSPSSQLVLFASSSLAFTGAATGFWLLTAWLVIGRAGLGMLIPALNVGVGAVASLSGTELAYASSSVNFVRQLGRAAGVNVLAVLLEWRLGVYGTANGARAFHECFALVTLAFAVAIMPAWSIRKSRR